MLSYLHGFHAGNHADILKHAALFYTIEYLNKKNKPYSFFDTHSGSGLYNLKSEEALKTGEAEKGIVKILENYSRHPLSVPEQLKPYLDFVNDSLKKGFYPGSPAIEENLRQKDSVLFLTELHKKEFEKLSENISRLEKEINSVENDEKINPAVVKNASGWENLKKSTPPAVKRGAILCDPSYEELSDYENASEILNLVHKKWSGATIMLWYPLLAWRNDEIENMIQRIFAYAKNQNGNTEILDARLLIDRPDSHIETTLEESAGSEKPRLYGSGLLTVNPCWGMDEYLKKILPYISQTLGNEGNGSWEVKFLEN